MSLTFQIIPPHWNITWNCSEHANNDGHQFYTLLHSFVFSFIAQPTCLFPTFHGFILKPAGVISTDFNCSLSARIKHGNFGLDDSDWISKFHKIVSFSRTDSGFCMLQCFTLSNPSSLHHSQRVTVPPQSCLFLYSLVFLLIWSQNITFIIHTIILFICRIVMLFNQGSECSICLVLCLFERGSILLLYLYVWPLSFST